MAPPYAYLLAVHMCVRVLFAHAHFCMYNRHVHVYVHFWHLYCIYHWYVKTISGCLRVVIQFFDISFLTRLLLLFSFP